MAFAVRGLTANFIRAHLDDPGWFPSGIYAVFDQQAQDWLDGRGSIFVIEDSSRTDAIIYPPGYPLWVAAIYKVTGSRSPTVVQNVQWTLDSLSVTLIVLIGATAFSWRAGLWAGALAALWPLPAAYGALPLADAPTSWFVLAAALMMLIAVRRKNYGWALAAGALVGLSCWLRANAILLIVCWALAVMLFANAAWKVRLGLAGSLIFAALFSMAPIVARNYFAFHEFVPTGLGAGTNLLEGIGETARGRNDFGAPGTDRELADQERAAMNVPTDARFDLYYPDGINRDRARWRRAFGIIAGHPFWYCSSVVRRMAAVLKYAGEPNGIYGSAGINITSRKCLPQNWQSGAISAPVNALGMLQSVLRYLLLPLIILGIIVAFLADRRLTALILSTVFYYWVIGSLIHTHIRYGLPMHALLTIFAGLTLITIKDFVSAKYFRFDDGRR